MLFCRDFCGILVENCRNFIGTWGLNIKFTTLYSSKIGVIHLDTLAKYYNLGDFKRIKLLWDNFENIDESNNQTLLISVLLENYNMFTKRFMDFNYKFYDKMNKTFVMLYLFIKKNNLNMVKFICQKCNYDIKYLNISMYWAGVFGHLNIVKFLVNKGVVITSCGHNALGIAIKYGRLDVIKYIESLGIPIDNKYTYMLDKAIENGNINVLKFLIKRKINIPNKFEILCSACKKGYLDLIKYLVENGVNVTFDNNYAVQLANLYKHKKVVGYLKSKGAKLNNGCCIII